MSSENGKGALRRAAVTGTVFVALAVGVSQGAQSGSQAGESAAAIDLRKHDGLAAGARKDADAKRAKANQLETKARSIDAQIADLERGQGVRSSELANGRSEVLRLEAENPQLDAANRRLAEEIALSRQEIAARQATLDPIAQGRRAVADQLSRELTTLASFVQRLDRANADLRRVSEDAADRDANLRDDSLSLRQSLDRRNDELQNLSRINSEIGAIPPEIAQRERDLRLLQSDIPALRQRVNIDENARRRQQQEMAPIRQRADEARREVDDANRTLKPIRARGDEIARELQKIDQRIAQAKGQLAGLDRDNATETERERKARESIVATENAVQGGVARKSVIDQTRKEGLSDIERLVAERKPIEEKIAIVQSEIARLKSSRDPEIAARMAERVAELFELNAQLSKINAEIERRNVELRAAQREGERLDNEIAAARRNIAESTRLAEQLRASISRREGQRAGVVQEIDRLGATRQPVQTEMDRVLPQFVEAEQRVKVAEARLRPIEQELRREDGVLERIERDLDQSRRFLDANRDDRLALEDRIRDLEVRLGQLQTLSAQVSSDIRALDFQIPALQSRVSTGEIELNRLRAQENALRQSRATAESDRARQDQIVKALQDQLSERDQRAGELTERSHSLAGQIERSQKQIAENNETMRRNTAAVQSLRASIPQRENALALAGNRLPALRSAATAAWAEFRPADADASAAESASAAAAAKAAEVRSGYDRQRLEARQVGEKQGASQGTTAGRAQGVADGEVSGREAGSAAGRREGLAAGLAHGAADGAAKGSVDGYRRGYEASSNYQEGLAKGIEQGVRDAWEEAQRVENPKGHAARRAELMAGVLTLPLASPSPFVTRPSAAITAVGKTGDLTSQSEAKPSDPAAPAAVGGGRPARTPATPALPDAPPNCALGYADLNQACLEGFKETFQSSYIDAYSAAFDVSSERAFAAARQAAYDANINARYTEGYDPSYQNAFAEGERIGAAAAREKGFAAGRSQGFDRTIAEARAAEFEKGRDDESRFFADNPVVRIVTAAFSEVAPDGEAGDLVAGDTLALDITLVNFGGIAAGPGAVKAQLKELTPTIATGTQEFSLPAIAASRANAVIRTPLAIVPNLPEGSEISGTVVVILPDGETQRIPLAAVVAANLPLGIEQLSTETNPRIGKAYGLTVKIRNSSQQDTFDDLRVVLSADSTIVRIDKAEANIRKLKAGQTGEAELKFTVLPPDAAGKAIRLKIAVFHGRNVSARATATVVPKE